MERMVERGRSLNMGWGMGRLCCVVWCGARRGTTVGEAVERGSGLHVGITFAKVVVE